MEINPLPKKRWFTTFWIKFRSRFKTKRPFSLTRPGWVFILYTIGVGAGAINTGNNLLYLIFGLFLGMIMASGVLSDLSLWGLAASVTVPTYASVGQPLFIQLHLRNQKKWISSLSVRVALDGTLEGQPIKIELYVPSLSALGHYHGQFSFIPEHRGLFEIQKIKFLTRFPFGLLLKWWTHLDSENESDQLHSLGYQAVVFPRTYRLPQRFLHQLEERADHQNLINKNGDGATLRGIRSYDPSDSPRRIHWKASAKRNSFFSSGQPDWLVKELDAEGKESTQINWPVWSELQKKSVSEFEEFISFTASLLQTLEAQHHQVSFQLPLENGVESLLLSDSVKLLTFLALIKKGDPLDVRLIAPMKRIALSRRGIVTQAAFEQFKLLSKNNGN